MGTHKLAGFTIIETVLFLGISSLLVVTLIVGAGVSLAQQRYKDATETFKLVLQQQYADINSVKNDRTDDWWCGSDAAPNDTSGTSQVRGQSDCMLIGKYVRVENGDIATYDVIGYGEEPTSPTNDIDTLRNNYKLNVSKAQVDESRMEWGTTIAWPRTVKGVGVTDIPRKLGILIVRSPTSGQIYTFSNKGNDVPDAEAINPSTFSDMLVAGISSPGKQNEQIICIDSGGLYWNGSLGAGNSSTSDRAVYLNSYASGSSAVELRTNTFMTPAVAEC